jgi:hypothetical protein
LLSKRHQKLGIKQTVQRHWMDRVVQMLLAGMSEKEIRVDLNDYLSTQKQSGGIGERGKDTYGMAISLLACWFAPDKELIQFRDDALNLARESLTSEWLPLHWAVISAAYPFWFNVAKQTGRLFNLQEQITQAQVFNRLKEQYGDRETVARNARYTVRSFIAWEVLKDSSSKGCYEQASPQIIYDPALAILLLEAGLHAEPEGKSALKVLLTNPALFPFQLPIMTGDFIANNCGRIKVVRYGMDDELLELKEK